MSFQTPFSYDTDIAVAYALFAPLERIIESCVDWFAMCDLKRIAQFDTDAVWVSQDGWLLCLGEVCQKSNGKQPFTIMCVWVDLDFSADFDITFLIEDITVHDQDGCPQEIETLLISSPYGKNWEEHTARIAGNAYRNEQLKLSDEWNWHWQKLQLTAREWAQSYYYEWVQNGSYEIMAERSGIITKQLNPPEDYSETLTNSILPPILPDHEASVDDWLIYKFEMGACGVDINYESLAELSPYSVSYLSRKSNEVKSALRRKYGLSENETPAR